MTWWLYGNTYNFLQPVRVLPQTWGIGLIRRACSMAPAQHNQYQPPHSERRVRSAIVGAVRHNRLMQFDFGA